MEARCPRCGNEINLELIKFSSIWKVITCEACGQKSVILVWWRGYTLNEIVFIKAIEKG